MSERGGRELKKLTASGGFSSPSSRVLLAADCHRQSTSDDDSGYVADEYAWVPSGCRPDTMHAYFSSLPPSRVPLLGSVGEKWRLRQLRHQLPDHDTDATFCGHLAPRDVALFVLFDQKRVAECLDRGVVRTIPYGRAPLACSHCGSCLAEGAVAVWAERVGGWAHPACFACTKCGELLVDLVYYAHRGKAFCGRHHAEKLRPRCARCDELIFSEDCVEAEGVSWHVDHFACSLCGRGLAGHSYSRTPSGATVCKRCTSGGGRGGAWKALPADSRCCTSCTRRLLSCEAAVCHSGFSWHASSSCFRCARCGRGLLGEDFRLDPPGRLACDPGCPDPRVTPDSLPSPPPSAYSLNLSSSPSPFHSPPASLHNHSSLSSSSSRPSASAENVYETVESVDLQLPPGPLPPLPPALRRLRPCRSLHSQPFPRFDPQSDPDYPASSSDDDDLCNGEDDRRARGVGSAATLRATRRLTRSRSSKRCLVS